MAVPGIQILRQWDGDIARMLDGRFQFARDARRPTDRNVRLSLAYLANLQWAEDRPSTPDVFADVRDLPQPPWRVRMVDNHILSIYLGLVGRYMATPLEPEVTASGPDPQDQLAARAATRVLRHLYSMEADDGAVGLEHQAADFYGWLVAAGRVYLYGYWDPEAWVETPNGSRQIGDVRTAVLTPFEVYGDPSARRFAEAHWAFRSVIRNVDELKLEYPDEAKRIQPERLRTEAPIPPTQASSMRSGLWLRVPEIRDSVMLREYFERPSLRYPEGRYAVYAGGGKNPVLLRYDEALPYGHRRIPIREVGYIRVPGAYNAMGIVEPLRDPQRFLNEIQSRRIEHIRMMATGKWLVDYEAGVAKDAITSEPGEVIFKHVGGTVQHVPMAPLPPDVQDEISMLEASMQRIGQLQEFGVQAPGGGRQTAVAAMIQRELQDLSRVPFQAELKSALQRFFRDLLEIARERYVETRLFRFGSGTEAESQALRGADLKGEWNVAFNVPLMGPLSRSERQQLGVEWLQLGVFGQPGREDTLERFLRFTGMEGSIPAPPQSVDAEVAEQENRGMEQGDVYQPGLLDDHSTHLQHHIPDYQRCSINEADPMELAIKGDHIRKHMTMLQSQLKDQAAEDAASQPPPGSPGGGPGGHPHGKEAPPGEGASPSPPGGLA